VAAERVEVVPLNVVDANAKVVATAVWESSTRHGTLGRRVRVATVRGYETEARALADRLSAHSGLEATVRHPLELVTAGGRTPGEAPGRLTIPLEPELRADEAVRRILQHLYGTMLDNEPYLADAPDTEFLHDYRVALRRSRSALKQAKGVLAAGLLEEWRPVLADLQQRTGPLRDLDVFILEFESYRDAVPPEFSEDLQPLHALLRRKRTAAHRTLVRYLHAAGHDRFKDRYADFLVAFRPASPLDAPDGQRPVAEVASERIRRAFTRLVRRGRGVRHDSPSAAVHDLRIRGKELRYALELNGALFQPDQLDELVGRLKRLQDRLGTFQDAEVHATAMDGFADELARRGHAPVRSLMAIGLLSQYFREQQAEVRTEIADRFVAFNRKSTHKQVARVLGGATGAV
jgi:CHAD domain-containing protein